MSTRVFYLLFLFSFCFIKIGFSQPQLVWSKIYNYTNLQDIPSNILIDDSEDVYVVGQAEISNNPQTNFDAIILKYDKLGNLEWFRKHSLSSFGDDRFICASITDNGNILVSGNMQVGSTLKMLNIMYSSEGDTIWTDVQNYDGYGDNNFRKIYLLNDNYIILDFIYAGTGTKLMIVKYSNNGTLQEINYTTEIPGVPQDINIVLADLDYFILSYNKILISNLVQPALQKIYLNGEKAWEKVLIDTTINILTLNNVEDDSNNIYSLSYESAYGNSVCYLTKLDSSGSILWHQIYNLPIEGEISPVSLLMNNDRDIKIVGICKVWKGGINKSGIFILTYSNSGDLINFHSQFLNEYIFNLVDTKIDSQSNLYMAMSGQVQNSVYDYIIAKFDILDSLLYEIKYDYNNLGIYSEEAVAFYLAGEDNYVITGRGGSPSETYNIITVRFKKNISSVSDTYFHREFTLSQNYPNPFNPSTKISWQSPVGSWQTLKVFDVLGNEVAILVNEEKPAGSYEVEFKSSVGSGSSKGVPSGLASGIYFYRLQAGSYVETKKMILIK